ncbi:response regulator transcription factor [Microbulbifer sp. ALW1]|uniref:response regulator transcription factor n=1 Tax=Microbulbifer sp. (strain ALW1) TaxID=1516059 RepID=UPI00135716C4|nr:helix-turn-helix transcriptional regulator [Microbulbifer sp. ALW1]
MLGAGFRVLLVGDNETSGTLEGPEVSRDLPGELPSVREAADSSPATLFSRREKEVLALIAVGATSGDIADRLSISTHTVKNHRKNILRKAGCRNSGQLIAKCVARNIV